MTFYCKLLRRDWDGEVGFKDILKVQKWRPIKFSKCLVQYKKSPYKYTKLFKKNIYNYGIHERTWLQFFSSDFETQYFVDIFMTQLLKLGNVSSQINSVYALFLTKYLQTNTQNVTFLCIIMIKRIIRQINIWENCDFIQIF